MLLAIAASVTVQSLLGEMNDLSRLVWPANYTAAQTSSYDRASKSPAVEWFANGDAGKYLRDEVVDGRKEHVMADLIGPGAVTRIWSANPAGRVRFYFDGETKARFEAPLGDLLRGKVPPFGDQYAYEAARGCNIYFPFPYAKSLKITVDDSGDVRGLYYHVGYRTYAPGTQVETFQVESAGLAAPTKPHTSLLQIRKEAKTLEKGQQSVVELRAQGVVREFVVQLGGHSEKGVWKDPGAAHNILRSLILTIETDGEITTVAPLGDFFGSAPGIVPYRSQIMDVEASGKMICRLPMPFARSMKIRVENRGSARAWVSTQAKYERVDSVPPYRLRAQWEYERGRTRPMRDLKFVDATGEGRFVGTFLHVENPTPAWWGEGDEKVYVDGEAFPSTFGTGTEDYFGYAWCCPETFVRPYHGQPRCDGPGNFGHTGIYRWQTFDDIPFTKSLQFDIEMWHWADVTGTWARTSYWYAKPGSKGNHPISVKLPIELTAPKPVVGAIEGESLKVLQATGGKHEIQEGFWEISGQKQRWWMDANAGDVLVIELPVKQSGRFEVVANLCHAKDYGIHEISLNGKKLATIDFYSDGLGWKKHTLGTVNLDPGTARLEITCKGNNPKAIARRMFGLDYLLLNKK